MCLSGLLDGYTPVLHNVACVYTNIVVYIHKCTMQLSVLHCCCECVCQDGYTPIVHDVACTFRKCILQWNVYVLLLFCLSPALGSQIKVADRPVTQQGLGGMKTGGKGWAISGLSVSIQSSMCC